ncbi:MAG TPA: IMP cyclohydrolase [Bacillota bacterium]|nr:IMP cyclohydrolase [Bacillota bacterium]
MNELLQKNLQRLKENPYPGRGIIQGMTPDEQHMVQVYWIMGRSENSRNRVFVEENGFVKTKLWDESKVSDPSLIIYYPARHIQKAHIITNGDQTDTIFNAVREGKSFEAALDTRTFEPDAPNFTPRISGIIDLADQQYAYRLSILKSFHNDSEYTQRHNFLYERPIPGAGHCIHTYAGDGNPLPSFAGEPYVLPLLNDPAETADLYWRTLNTENKVSLLVKFIDHKSGQAKLVIVNKHR